MYTQPAARWEAFDKLVADWNAGRILYRPRNRQAPKPRALQLSGKIRDCVLNQKLDELLGGADLAHCSQAQYPEFLQLLHDAEELYQAVRMGKHTFKIDELSESLEWYDETLRGFKLEGLNHRKPDICRKDFVILKSDSERVAVAMQIEHICGDAIYLPPLDYKLYAHLLEGPLSVAFQSLGVPFQHCQAAVERLKFDLALRKLVFGGILEPHRIEAKIDVVATNTAELQARLDALRDADQVRAIVGCLEALCGPRPYLVTGGPGTGKTSVFKELVIQIIKRLSVGARKTDGQPGRERDSFKKRAKIKQALVLVCVNSNSCARQLHDDLERELPEIKILRLNSGKFLREQDEPDVVIATNIKAGSLADECEFEWVLIDEANHAIVPESLVPARLLKPGGCLVLAGDLKQLRPVTMCKQAGALGLGTSLLEKLLEENEVYQHDARFATRLNRCHRSDARLIGLPNELFYENSLLSSGGAATPGWLLERLALSWPIQKRNVDGREESKTGPNSFFNKAEADTIAELIVLLLDLGVAPEMIGVATPFKLQSIEIRAALNRRARILIEEYYPVRLTWEQAEALSEGREELCELLQAALGTKFYRRVGSRKYVEYDIGTYAKNPAVVYERRLVTRHHACRTVKVDLADGFQGCERPVMFISTVRNNPDSQLGALLEPNRFNLMVTRAKWLLIVVGSMRMLEQSDLWRKLLAGAKTEVDAWPASIEHGSKLRFS